MTPNSGVYVLLIRSPARRRISVGALGSRIFPRGHYLYIGSAKVGLRSRIARHLRRGKPLRWHIDYLLQYARPIAVATFDWRTGAECRLARHVADGPAEGFIEGFGSSDCRCPTHLFRVPGLPPRAWVGHLLGDLPRALTMQTVADVGPGAVSLRDD